MKKDNSNIVVPENLEQIVSKWCIDNTWFHAYTLNRKFGNELFEAGANWQKEQYKDLVQSHAELLDIVNGLSVIFYKELQTKLMPDEKTPMYPLIKAARIKAIKLNIQ